MITIDIDTGGTMTDCLVSDGEEKHSIKVDTTPHDYTVSFLKCLEAAAEIYGRDSVEDLLVDVNLIRWSSTITTNVLAERRGAKIGLLVSVGHEEDLYGDDRSICVDELVAAENVVGIDPDAEAAEVLMAVKDLLETGARRICISLGGNFPDNKQEIAMKDVIEDQYPDHIIGSVPVLLGSDMAPITHDQTRAHYSLMNAYTHSHLATSLFKAEDLLRDDHRWNGALLIGHTSGGVARVGKTKAVDTIESGPVFGTFGGAYMAGQYGLDKVACFDVGGTTTKASVILDGKPVFQRGGDLMEIPVQTSFAMLRSSAIGGGSVARSKDGVIVLGPDSMGAAPGPACYGLGGREATITDALIVLGYLDADNFLGGRRKLDADRAAKAIERAIAKPMEVSVDQAAIMIRDEAVAVMADLVGETLAEAGTQSSDAALFCFGGNGPMFGAFIADKLGMDQVYFFDLGPVFSAFGSAQSNVSHVYERGSGKPLGGDVLQVAKTLYDQAWRDLEGEGFDPSEATYEYVLETSESDAEERAFAFDGVPDEAWLEKARGALGDHAAANIVVVQLKSDFAVESHGVAEKSTGGTPVSATPRPIAFHGAPEQTPTFSWEDMPVGQEVAGPAVINGSTLTCPVPKGWKVTVDRFGNGLMTRA